MRNIASIVLVCAFIASIALLPISRLPELAAYAPMLLIGAGTLCAAASAGLVLVSADAFRSRS